MRTHSVRLWLNFLVAFCLIATFDRSTLPAAQGVTSDTIIFGQSACFTGPNRKLGTHYKVGIEAAFAVRNDRGGVKGRSLELISFDDAYEPGRAGANAEMFVSEDKVLAVIGGVGTPTARRIVPVLKTAKIPFVGPFTGADFLRNAGQYPNVVNLRASYFDETRELVEHIIRDRGKNRMGIIYQEDAFGRAVLRDFKTVLDSYNIPILGKTFFSRNTHAVHASLFALAKADLDAILIVGSYAANSTIINLANSLGHDYIMGCLSFVLSQELKARVSEPNDRILVTQVVPDPRDETLDLVRQFRQAVRSLDSEMEEYQELINEVCLEGYILGRFVISVLERMGDELTRDNFIKQALSSGPIPIDDWIIQFEPGNNAGSRYVRLTDLGEDGTHEKKGSH